MQLTSSGYLEVSVEAEREYASFVFLNEAKVRIILRIRKFFRIFFCFLTYKLEEEL